MRSALLIGGMKCGTNSLYHALKTHPEIACATTKELDYFLKEYPRSPYGMHFQIDERSKVTLDGTTQYSKYPAIKAMASAVCTHLPDAQIVYMIRDPIERLESNIAHHIARGEKISLDTWREGPTLRNAVNFSMYYTQISPYVALLGRQRVFVGVFEEFVRNQEEFIASVCTFLDVDPRGALGAQEKRNPRRNENRADLLSFTEEDDAVFANELKPDIECLAYSFEIDVGYWWPRYARAVR